MDQAPPKGTSKPLSKNDQDILRTGREAKAFVDSKFGKYYIGLLEGALAAKRAEYEAPAEVVAGIDGVSQILRAESAKGAIMGIRLATSILNGMVTAADTLRRDKGLTANSEDDE